MFFRAERLCERERRPNQSLRPIRASLERTIFGSGQRFDAIYQKFRATKGSVDRRALYVCSADLLGWGWRARPFPSFPDFRRWLARPGPACLSLFLFWKTSGISFIFSAVYASSVCWARNRSADLIGLFQDFKQHTKNLQISNAPVYPATPVTYVRGQVVPVRLRHRPRSDQDKTPAPYLEATEIPKEEWSIISAKRTRREHDMGSDVVRPHPSVARTYVRAGAGFICTLRTMVDEGVKVKPGLANDFRN